ncbi:uncharacterized protein [Rutidosis leptorrhynchoides]|uniref:uncharacterized protein n=1 Tax=Rutidosis leptorrhynchoides TaxID=125765 RepID=UPI003A9A5866
MGKQWLLFNMASDQGATDGCHGTTNTKSAGKSRKRRGDKPTSSSRSTSSSSSFSGCMSAIFHMFDIQHHHLPFHQPHSFISESSTNVPPQEPKNSILKGVEAPRNSLELEQERKQEPMVGSSSSSLSTKVKQETNFNIPIGGIKIKTKRSRLLIDTTDVSSECSSSSPSTKTPSLVARLMGLDLLPENSSPRTSSSSPRPSSSSSHATPSNRLSKILSSHNKLNARSLPVTPRASTGTRTSTEVDYHHRLSLQSNKENRRKFDENTNEYAKQLAKQVRENISRRVGADITNTLDKKEQRRSTPLSNHLVNLNTSTKFISFKKDIASPCSTTLSQKQVTIESITHLPSCQSQSYNTKLTHKPSIQDDVTFNGNGVTTSTTTTGVKFSGYFDYISRILSQTGIEKATPITITHWYSPSHPLHPSILQKVNRPTTVLDRKLIFDVTNELLVEILKPYINFKPWVEQQKSKRMNGSDLVAKLTEKIQSFPAMDCQTLEDIDRLIKGDMRSCTRVIGEMAFDEEAEVLVAEIERDMVDTLVGEMAVSGMMMCHVGFGC